MKNFNPALHTFEEYYKMISDGRFHEDGAYSVNLKRFNEYNKVEDFKILIYRFKLHGRTFELRESREDKRQWGMIKRDENGDYITKENGKFEYYSKEELEKLLPEEKRWEIQHCIVDQKNGLKVAATQNEWGCVLVNVANEYKGLGLGQVLLDHHRKVKPLTWSGGHTPEGYKAFTRTYQKRVQEAMVSGLYTSLVKNGEMSVERAKEIIKSANIRKEDVLEKNIESGRIGKGRNWGEKVTYREEMKEKFDRGLNLDFSNPDDFMIHINEFDNTAILYNKRFYEIFKDEKYTSDYLNQFINEGIKGYVYLGATFGTDTAPLFYHVHGEKDKHKSMLIELLLNANLNEKVRIAEEDYHLLSSKILDKCELIKEDNNMTELRLTSRTVDPKLINSIKKLDTLYRKKVDPYEESFTIIHERAYANAKSTYEKEESERKKMSDDIKSILASKIENTELKNRLKIKGLSR